jgi:tetrahydromethanopterin S-methyltransferase subunit A
MEQQKLRDLLENLHHELEQVESVDETTVAVLSSLREDIRKLVDDKDAIHESEPLVVRFNEAIDHFEADHPKLSMTIQHVLDSLARMGL